MSASTAAPSIEIGDGNTWAADGPLKEILSAFNGGSPLNIVNGVKTALSDGFTIVGTAQFMNNTDAKINLTALKNGDITLLAQLAEVQLSHLLGSATHFQMVRGFEVPMPSTSVLIKRSGGTLSLNAAAMIANIGEAVFVAEYGSQWEVALGFRLDVATIAALPGLHGSPLATFDNVIGLSDAMMVISSRDNAQFDFPELSNFQTPALGRGKLVLPKQAAGKLVEGLNVYAALSTSKGSAFQSIAKFFNLKLDGSIGVTLAVSLPDPATQSKLFLSVSEEIKRGVTLTGELGFLLAGGEAGVFLTAEAVAPIQGQPAQFDVTALAVENGVLFSGSMINKVPIHFDIDHVRFHLANLGLVIGIDGEGIPSLGFCATIDIDRFDAAVAVFIDSTDPAKSMFAAAVSDLSLLDVVEVLANQTNLPAPLKETLDVFGVKPLGSFSLPATIAHALDHRDLPTIAKAFNDHGHTIPTSSDQVLLDVNTPGQLWYLTDLKVMNHYVIKCANNAVTVSYEPQLYVAPQATAIGAINFPPGFKVLGEIDLLLLRAAIDIEIKGLTGIYADLYVEPIIIFNKDFFAITGAGGVGGPYVSLATYTRPEEKDPHFREPHFAISGDLRLLGADVASVYMNFSKAGIVFDLQAQIGPARVVKIDLNANIQNAQNLNLGGSIQIGVNNRINLGPLGSVLICLDAHGSLNVGVRNGTAFARFQAGLQFESWQIQTPVIELDVNGPALVHIADQLLAELEHLLVDGLMHDVARFMDWAKRGVLKGVRSVEQIAGVLKNVYKLAAAEAGKLLHQFGHDIHEIANSLKTVFGQAAHEITDIFKNVLGLHSDVINGALKAAGFAEHEVESVLSDAFDFKKSRLYPWNW
jgi:hypothetical protein